LSSGAEDGDEAGCELSETCSAVGARKRMIKPENFGYEKKPANVCGSFGALPYSRRRKK
jgi:hypothetical protein